MNLRGLIFDFDGTLADTLPVCYIAFRKVFEEYLGNEFEDREIAQLFGPSETGILQRMIPDRWEGALQRYLELYQASHSSTNTEIPGVRTLLSMVMGNELPMAVVTGKGLESAQISLKYLELDKYFQIVEAGKAEGADKPAAIERVLHHWEVSPETVCYVGDSTYDIRAAKEAGVYPIAACWAAPERAADLKREEPNEMFFEVEQFQNWLLTECILERES